MTKPHPLRDLAERLTAAIKQCRPGEGDGFYGGYDDGPLSDRAIVMLMLHNNYACHEVAIEVVYGKDGKPAIGSAYIEDMCLARTGSPVGNVRPNSTGPTWLLAPVAIDNAS